jgi:hypothetical protein
MIRTFNRQPLSVNIPNKNDVEHNYLNQYNWKGLIDNKNFLAVDQESFSDCNNVYVDEQGLLKSRPSLKVKNLDIDNILDCWTFDMVDIYKTDTKLIFINKNFSNKVSINKTIFVNDSSCKVNPSAVMTTQNYLTITKWKNTYPYFPEKEEGTTGKCVRYSKFMFDIFNGDIRNMHISNHV